jgi:hypothetical protein
MMTARNRAIRLWILFGVSVVAIVSISMVSRIPQAEDYHRFADARELFAVPNFWNVVSNVPFLIVGLLGVLVVAKGRYEGGLRTLRLHYLIFFASVALVCVGSGYYHWMPSNETLVWDRLPMSIAFMTLLAIVIGEHIDERTAMTALGPLIALGIASVWYWNYTELLGQGDLRAYALVQFLTLALIALVLVLFPSRLSGTQYLWGMFLGYAIAKLLEEFDHQVYDASGHVMSGHALKHVVAAISLWLFVAALQRRRLRGIVS